MNPKVVGFHYPDVAIKSENLGLQREGPDDPVPQDVPEDHGTGGGDTCLAGPEGQDAGGEADGTEGVKQDRSTVG